MDANGIGLCGRCSIVHTDPTLGVGPSAFALENLKQGLTGCTECSGCDHQAVLCRVGGRTSDQRDIQFESIPLEFGRDVSVQTPYHKYTQEVLVKVFGASYPRIILEGSQSPAILTNESPGVLEKIQTACNCAQTRLSRHSSLERRAVCCKPRVVVVDDR